MSEEVMFISGEVLVDGKKKSFHGWSRDLEFLNQDLNDETVACGTHEVFVDGVSQGEITGKFFARKDGDYRY